MLKTFTEDHRYDINLAYWIQTFAERRRWLDTNVFISNTNKTDDKVSNVALSYYLPTECGEKVRVGKRMFMAKLGMKTDGMITELVKKIRNQFYAISPAPIGKGKYKRNFREHENIREHINSIRLSVSMLLIGITWIMNCV